MRGLISFRCLIILSAASLWARDEEEDAGRGAKEEDSTPLGCCKRIRIFRTGFWEFFSQYSKEQTTLDTRESSKSSRILEVIGLNFSCGTLLRSADEVQGGRAHCGLLCRMGRGAVTGIKQGGSLPPWFPEARILFFLCKSGQCPKQSKQTNGPCFEPTL